MLYPGLTKFDSLSKFFNSVLDGTADLKVANEETRTEEVIHETQQTQEAHRTALAHGEEDIKDRHEAVHDDEYTGAKDNASSQEEAIEDVKSEPQAVVAPTTGEDEQMVFEAIVETAPTEASFGVDPDEIKTAAATLSPEPVEDIKSDDAEHRDEL